jgi:hypothetical protein
MAVPDSDSRLECKVLNLPASNVSACLDGLKAGASRAGSA